MEEASLVAVVDEADGPEEPNENAGVEDEKAEEDDEEGVACVVLPLVELEAEGCDPNAKPEKDDLGCPGHSH